MNLARLRFSALALLAMLGGAPSSFASSASAQNGAEATVEALQTRVAELEAQNRGLATATADLQSGTSEIARTPTTARTPASDQVVELAPGLELLSYRFVRSGIYSADSDTKATFVLGTIKNTTNLMLDAPGLKFVLLDGAGNVGGDINGDPILPVILPGESMPFESAIFGDEPEPNEWETEQLELCDDWGATDHLARFDPTGLALQEVEETITNDRLSVEGVVFNGRDRPAEGVYIKAAVFDASGLFAGWFWTSIDVAIPVNKTARFAFDSFGDPQDPLGVAGPGYSFELWVGFDSPLGAC